MAFVKTGDGKVVDVIKTDELSAEQKQAIEEALKDSKKDNKSAN